MNTDSIAPKPVGRSTSWWLNSFFLAQAITLLPADSADQRRYIAPSQSCIAKTTKVAKRAKIAAKGLVLRPKYGEVLTSVRTGWPENGLCDGLGELCGLGGPIDRIGPKTICSLGANESASESKDPHRFTSTLLAKFCTTTRCRPHHSDPSQAGTPALQGCLRCCSTRVPAGDGSTCGDSCRNPEF
jgi:hypothetical protein